MGYEEEIEGPRKEINRLNEEIVEKIVQRVEVAVRIGVVKRKYGRPIVDAGREAKVYEQIRELAGSHGLDKEGLERIFIEIIKLCTEAQMEDHP
jgi:chorismate mutase